MRGIENSEIDSNQVCQNITRGEYQEDEVINSLRILGIQGRWDEVWNVSHALGVEISWIQDAEGTVFVDLGSSGEVRLSAPIGAVLPFRLWIHTHPWTAYWSFTDRTALRNFAGLLEVAIVLGNDHWKRSRCRLKMGEKLPDGIEDPLNMWTEEEIQNYPVISEVTV